MADVSKVVPTVGRIVHYHSYGTPGGEYPSKERAAIVADVYDMGAKVSLVVLNPEGLFFNKDVPYSEDPKPGHWSWMPYQKERQAEK